MNENISTSSPRATTNELRRTLKVGGITPFSTVDYPGKLAGVVFVQGCPWRCGYCHNPHLQSRLQASPLPWSQVLTLLRRRVGLIDAVVFSGGEPTLDPHLPEAITTVRELGFEIGLHSGGIYPRHLRDILPLLNWVGLDIKAPFNSYSRITGVADSGISARASAEAVLESGVPYEFRTTVHGALLNEKNILSLAEELVGMGAKHYALQSFRPQGCDNGALITYQGAETLTDNLIKKMTALFPYFTLRKS